MKRLLVLLICCVLLLSACGDQYTPKTDYAVDAQENDIGYQMTARIAESEDSFYFMRNNFLYVIDKKSRKCMPLCSRPDCRHDQGGENHQGGCDAYFSLGVEIINYRNELYYMDEGWYFDNNGQEIQVMKFGKMNLDGTNRTDIYQTEDMVLWSFKIHRGVIYFLASSYRDDGSADSNDQKLYTLPVSGKGEPQILVDMSGENKSCYDVRFCGDAMFLLEEIYVSEEEQCCQFWRIDLNTGEKVDINQKLQTPVKGLFTIWNNQIVYMDRNHLYACNLVGSGGRMIADCAQWLADSEWYKSKIDNGETVWFSVTTNDTETLIISASYETDLTDRMWIFLGSGYQPTAIYYPPFRTIHMEACNPDAMIVEEAVGKRLFYIDKTKLGEPDCAQEIYTFIG